MQLLKPAELEEKIFEIIAATCPKDRSVLARAVRRLAAIEGVRHWAKQLFFMTDGFGRFTSAIHSNCPVFDVRHVLAETIYEEHGRMLAKKDHPELYRKFTARSASRTPSWRRPTLARDGPVDRLAPRPLPSPTFRRGARRLRRRRRGPSQQGHPIFVEVFRNKYGSAKTPSNSGRPTRRTTSSTADARSRSSCSTPIPAATSRRARVRPQVDGAADAVHHGIGHAYAGPLSNERLAANA